MSNPTGKNRRRRQRRVVHGSVLYDAQPVEASELARAALERPKRRGDCAGGERPCPWVGCRYHLWLDVTEVGEISMIPGSDIEALQQTCALDVADQGGVTLEYVGELLGVTRERVRQIEYNALGKIRTVDPRSLRYDSRVARAANHLVAALPDDGVVEKTEERRRQIRELYRESRAKTRSLRGTP